MNNRLSGSQIHWYQSSLGEQIVQSGLDCIQKLIPKQYFRVTLQVAGPSDDRYINMTESDVRYRISTPTDSSYGTGIVAEAEWLPFASNSIDLLVLSHVLEFSSKPHDVLREVSECVAPEGIVVIAGVNPHSMLGLMKKINYIENSDLQNAKFYSVIRVRDWMALLSFESIAGEFTFFRPPVSQKNRLERLIKLESAGARWWPGFGSVYVLIFRKKVLGMRMNGNLVKRAFRTKRRVFSPIAERSKSSELGD